MTVKYTFGTFLVGLVLSSALAPAASAEGCGPISVDTLAVKVEVAKPAYAIGQTARFRVTVTRQVAGSDVMPAEGVDVVLAVTSRGVSVGGGGITDADGYSLVTVKLADHVRVGPADVSVTATRAPAHCVQEAGGVEILSLFRIMR
jgi:hypothetical protein